MAETNIGTKEETLPYSPLAANKIQTLEENQALFRSLGEKAELDVQLHFFQERFIKSLGKDGVLKTNEVKAEFKTRADGKQFDTVSTQFTDFLESFNINFASMKKRKEAFADLDVDKNGRISLIEVLIFMNKDIILENSEARWGEAPPASGDGYSEAVLRELFLPAQGFDKSFDDSLVAFIRSKEEKTEEMKKLEDSKEGMSAVKIRNVDMALNKIEKSLEQEVKDFDRLFPKAARIQAEAFKARVKLQEEINAESADKEKPKGGVNKGVFQDK